MKMTRSEFWTLAWFIGGFVFLTACSKQDEAPVAVPVVPERTYTLSALSGSGISGTVTFRKQNDTTMLITVRLTGTQAGNTHPAHIHANKASDGGPIVLDFTPVDGASGKSETTVSKLNDGTRITYEELINFNGHVNIHKSAAEIAVMIAQGNIGVNATPVSNPDNGNSGGYPGGY